MLATLAAGSRTSPVGCRACAASGHVVTAAPPSVMNSRRFISKSWPDALNGSVGNFGPMSASVNRVGLASGPLFPVHPNQRTSQDQPDWFGLCYMRT